MVVAGLEKKGKGWHYMFAGVTKQKESASTYSITPAYSSKTQSSSISAVSLTSSDLNKSLAWVAHMYNPTCHC